MRSVTTCAYAFKAQVSKHNLLGNKYSINKSSLDEHGHTTTPQRQDLNAMLNVMVGDEAFAL